MNTVIEKVSNSQVVDRKAAKKASTNEIPMVDLGVILEFVGKIESEGLQTLPAQEVAKRTGFAAPTSTPFYRRMAAAKLFGLLDTTQGVNLTRLALDYFKPTDDESQAAALVTAMKNVVGYQKLLERFSGRRLPPQLDILANLFEREFSVTPEAAKVCASVFVNSGRRAGLVQEDGTLSTAPPVKTASPLVPEKAATQSSHSPVPSLPVSGDSESHFLTLDAKRGRRVILHGPPVITASELKRIQNWLAVQFHVVDSLNGSEPANRAPESTEGSNAPGS